MKIMTQQTAPEPSLPAKPDDMLDAARKKTIYGTEPIPLSQNRKGADTAPDLIFPDIADTVGDWTWDLFDN